MMDRETMETDKVDLLRHNLKKISWLSFNKLDNYFCNPDVKIKNISTITAQKFADDLDTVIQYSKLNPNKSIGKTTIRVEPNQPSECQVAVASNENQQPLRHKHSKFGHALIKSLKASIFGASDIPHLETIDKKILITSWNYNDFKSTDCFSVGRIYSIKPVSLTYNYTTEGYEYDRQIISRFYIESADGDSKKMIITDTIKNGKVKREKRIDNVIVSGQNYQFEIRNHRLNRSVIKAFLFKQVKEMKQTSSCQPLPYASKTPPMFSDTEIVSKTMTHNIYYLPHDRKFDIHGMADDYSKTIPLEERKIIN